ncbi:MAG TPA: hypothetical protein VF746_26605 [Longimicrobium sp.]|jgi:hypothetical protein
MRRLQACVVPRVSSTGPGGWHLPGGGGVQDADAVELPGAENR